MRNIPIYYGISITEDSKGNKAYSFTNSHVKYNDSLPSYQYISSRVSTNLIQTLKLMKNHRNNVYIVWDRHKDKDLEKRK